jgi:hypothetical protein
MLCIVQKVEFNKSIKLSYSEKATIIYLVTSNHKREYTPPRTPKISGLKSQVFRAVGRSENPWVPIEMWGHNRPPWLI